MLLKNISTRFLITTILILYSILALASYYIFGINVVLDSARYLDYAENISQGFYLDPHNTWYLGYVLFISCIKLLTENLSVIILAQYIVGGIAVFYLFQAALELSESKIAAFGAALYYILFLEPITWHSYILAESLLGSFICISLYIVIKTLRNQSAVCYSILIPILLFTASIKPTAIGIAFSLVTFLSVKFLQKISTVKIILGVLTVITLFILLEKSLTTFTILENDYLQGEIIYRFDRINNSTYQHWFIIDVPDEIYFPDAELPKLLQIALFIFHNPIYWLKLFSLKIFYLLLHARPYWSIPHIIHSVVFMMVGLGSFIYALARSKFSLNLSIILIAFFGFQL
jgi:hypothetical protein